jgi:hypothetical protein
MALTRQQIEGIRDFQVVPVEVPGYGPICIRSWDGRARDIYDTKLMQQSRDVQRGDRTFSELHDLRGLTATLLALSICDEAGGLLFDAERPADLKLLDSRGLTFAQTLRTEIRKLNKLEPGAVEDAEKKSDA